MGTPWGHPETKYQEMPGAEMCPPGSPLLPRDPRGAAPCPSPTGSPFSPFRPESPIGPRGPWRGKTRMRGRVHGRERG